jgi:hypothetical protein
MYWRSASTPTVTRVRLTSLVRDTRLQTGLQSQRIKTREPQATVAVAGVIFGNHELRWARLIVQIMAALHR